MNLAAGCRQQDTVSDYFGRMVAVIPDCDNDSASDYLVGEGYSNSSTGAVTALSSRSHKRLFVVTGSKIGEQFGAFDIYGIPDMDDDGIDDEIVETNDSSVLLSLKKHRKICAINVVGSRLLATVDLNNDKQRDLIYCRGETPRVFDGKSGKELNVTLSSTTIGMIPSSISSPGVRALGLVLRPDGTAAFLECLKSIETEFQLASFSLAEPTWSVDELRLDRTALVAADLDGDNALELIRLSKVGRAVGLESLKYTMILSVHHSRNAAEDFSICRDIAVNSPPRMASTICLPGDIDKDGVIDIVWCNPSHSDQSGGVFLFSGKAGSELWRLRPPKRLAYNGAMVDVEIGTSIAVGPDVDGDGIADLLVGGGSYTDESLAADGIVLVVGARTGEILWKMNEGNVGRSGK